MTLVRIILGLCVGIGSVLSQTHGVKVGDLVHNFLFPPHEFIGSVSNMSGVATCDWSVLASYMIWFIVKKPQFEIHNTRTGTCINHLL